VLFADQSRRTTAQDRIGSLIPSQPWGMLNVIDGCFAFQGTRMKTIKCLHWGSPNQLPNWFIFVMQQAASSKAISRYEQGIFGARRNG